MNCWDDVVECIYRIFFFVGVGLNKQFEVVCVFGCVGGFRVVELFEQIYQQVFSNFVLQMVCVVVLGEVVCGFQVSIEWDS